MNFKKYTILTICYLVFGLIIACKTDKETVKQPRKALTAIEIEGQRQVNKSPVVTKAKAEGGNTNLEVQSLLLKEVLKSETGILLGVNFGENMSEAHQRLGLKTIERGEEFYKYEMPLSTDMDPTFADVSFYFDQQEKINKVELDVYTGNHEEAQAIQNDFQNYLNGKYGAANKDNIWGDGAVELQKTDLKDDPGFVVIWINQ